MTEERIVQLRRAIYRFFAEHARAPLPAEVGATPADLRELERVHAVVLDPAGTIAFSNPFAAGPTGFTVTAGPVRWYAVCAWDSLGILAATGRDGRVEATCPDCAAPIELRVAGGRLLPAEAGEAREAGGTSPHAGASTRQEGPVAHFLVPAARWYDDLGHT